MAEVIRLKKQFASLRCSSCGVSQNAACDCGVSYVPAGELAKKAVRENPEMTNHAIAKQYGVSSDTIRRARGDTRVGASAPTARRTGTDGKQYNAVKPKPAKKPDVKQEVTKWATRLDGFISDYTMELSVWMKAHPKLDDECKGTILEFLHVSADRLLKLNQKLQGR